MKTLPGFIFLFFTFLQSEAQRKIVFEVTVPSGHETDSIYLAGSFNQWDPKDTSYLLSPSGLARYARSVQLDSGSYEYKFTRGSWLAVECSPAGQDIPNRSLLVSSDTTFSVTIAAWKDDLPGTGKGSTASPNVHLLDSAFFMPQLNRSGPIWIYLPEEYANGRKHYPVIYMQDGQNLFDERGSAFGEWGVDECLDSLIKRNRPPCIIVGIGNGPRRVNEYNPFPTEQFGPGEGDAYLDFLVHTLKPFVDQHYRTLTNRENTGVAGSSLGGLIAYYALLRYPGVFGKGGIFSPSIWIAPQIRALTDSLASGMNSKVFCYIGEKEGEANQQKGKELIEALGDRSGMMIYWVTDPLSKHNEKAWRKWFPEFYQWIMADGFNYPVNLSF
ncbi:MAG: hypothetical protein IPI66_13020 [Chitinophagaceae bacterium]|nr:hypothetical protein [Chitinophagaceae bacterium]